MCGKKNITIYNNKHLTNIPFTMAHDKVDISLITNDRHKRKLPAYATNADNISAVKMMLSREWNLQVIQLKTKKVRNQIFPSIDKLLN